MSRSFRSFDALTLAAALAVMTAAACGKKAPDTPKPQPAPPPTVEATRTEPKPPPPPAPPPATPNRVPTEDEIYASLTPDEIAKKYLSDVFFDYDSVELTDQTRGSLQKNAEFMKRRTSVRILIEGHADSRGTNEYNLALGERRADAARDYLVSLGVPADRITVVSKGEEQPFCREETEACWQQNRRGHFIVTAR
jgi:peptidoglycan-associated lipoprotein